MIKFQNISLQTVNPL